MNLIIQLDRSNQSDGQVLSSQRRVDKLLQELKVQATTELGEGLKGEELVIGFMVTEADLYKVTDALLGQGFGIPRVYEWN